MLALSTEDIKRNSVIYLEEYRQAMKAALTEKDYLQKITPRMSKKVNRKYPYQVKIPKSMEEMKLGDFEPAKIITIDKPIEGPFGEMWFGDTSKGTLLLCGYKNGDSRYISDVMLGDSLVHGILAGATGQGKSVTQNAIIYGANYVYAPWELNMVLCDAKIVEFKSIAMNYPMPQIQAVAATTDADYLISVLEFYSRQMIERNAMFTKASSVFGTKIDKIETFRKVTGLALPQVIIDIDEFQAMFSQAKKKASSIVKILDSFARLGRNTGYHLLLASQEIGGDIPNNMLSNIKLRLAMGCTSQVSERILGNPKGADNYGKTGYMYSNADGGEDKKGDHNILYKVPFPPPDQMDIMGKAIVAKGKELGVTPIMNFYDEDAAIYESEYSNYLKQFKIGNDRIILGEPSYVVENDEPCVKMLLNGSDTENILIDCPTDWMMSRYIQMIKGNLALSPNVTVVVNNVRNEIEKQTGISQVAGRLSFTENNATASTFRRIAYATVYKRKMILEADKLLADKVRIANDASNKLFNEQFGTIPAFSSETFRQRFAHYLNIMSTDPGIQVGLGLVENEREAGKLKYSPAMMELAKSCMEMCCNFNCSTELVTYSSFPPAWFFDIGIDRVIGFGRSPKSANVTKYLRVLQDCSSVACRFVIVTSSINDINELLGGIRWIITEGIASNEISKLKLVEDYPETVSPKLAVLTDNSKTIGKCVKFKKLLHDGEMPS